MNFLKEFFPVLVAGIISIGGFLIKAEQEAKDNAGKTEDIPNDNLTQTKKDSASTYQKKKLRIKIKKLNIGGWSLFAILMISFVYTIYQRQNEISKAVKKRQDDSTKKVLQEKRFHTDSTNLVIVDSVLRISYEQTIKMLERQGLELDASQKDLSNANEKLQDQKGFFLENLFIEPSLTMKIITSHLPTKNDEQTFNELKQYKGTWNYQTYFSEENRELFFPEYKTKGYLNAMIGALHFSLDSIWNISLSITDSGRTYEESRFYGFGLNNFPHFNTVGEYRIGRDWDEKSLAIEFTNYRSTPDDSVNAIQFYRRLEKSDPKVVLTYFFNKKPNSEDIQKLKLHWDEFIKGIEINIPFKNLYANYKMIQSNRRYDSKYNTYSVTFKKTGECNLESY